MRYAVLCFTPFKLMQRVQLQMRAVYERLMNTTPSAIGLGGDHDAAENTDAVDDAVMLMRIHDAFLSSAVDGDVGALFSHRATFVGAARAACRSKGGKKAQHAWVPDLVCPVSMVRLLAVDGVDDGVAIGMLETAARVVDSMAISSPSAVFGPSMKSASCVRQLAGRGLHEFASCALTSVLGTFAKHWCAALRFVWAWRQHCVPSQGGRVH